LADIPLAAPAPVHFAKFPLVAGACKSRIDRPGSIGSARKLFPTSQPLKGEGQSLPRAALATKSCTRAKSKIPVFAQTNLS